MRRAARTDANQAEIVEALRAMGCAVWIIKWPVDLLVGYGGKWLPVEVKTPSGRLTDDQREFIATAKGPVAVVCDVESAVRAAKILAESA